jgi:hypothetical protein
MRVQKHTYSLYVNTRAPVPRSTGELTPQRSTRPTSRGELATQRTSRHPDSSHRDVVTNGPGPSGWRHTWGPTARGVASVTDVAGTTYPDRPGIPMPDGSRLTAHGSRLTAHGSRLTAHGSRLTAHGSRLTMDDLRLAVALAIGGFGWRLRLAVGRWLLVVGCWRSTVSGWPLATGRLAVADRRPSDLAAGGRRSAGRRHLFEADARRITGSFPGESTAQRSTRGVRSSCPTCPAS